MWRYIDYHIVTFNRSTSWNSQSLSRHRHPNGPHTWPVDGNETPPLHSGISRCCPVPYHLDWYVFCHRVGSRGDRVEQCLLCCADTIASQSTIHFGFPHLPHRSCPRRVLCWHISTFQRNTYVLLAKHIIISNRISMSQRRHLAIDKYGYS